MHTVDFHTHLLSKEVNFNRIYDKIVLSVFSKSLNTNKNILIKKFFDGYVQALINNIHTSQKFKKLIKG